jgi:protein gp37
VESALDKPLRWRKPRRVFVCSMGDLFHESVPDAWVLRVFETIAVCPQHTFQLLTKRPERMRAFLSLCEDWYSPEWPHVWLGVTVCNQEEADEKIPALLEIPAAVRFVSIEPMLGPVRLQLLSRPWCDDCHGTGWYGDNGPGIKGNREYVHCDCHDRRKIDWVIVGGETGPGARLMHPRWARQVLDQCHQANVPFFFKQWGPKRAGRLLDGREWNEMPTERR